MNLTGRWKGKYRYGAGYPRNIYGKRESFEFNIVDENGTITGTCTDNIVLSREGNESTIRGIFYDDFISFLKKYRYPAFAEGEENAGVSIDDIQFDGIHYSGKLSKKTFSGKPYFSGEWVITAAYMDKQTNKKIILNSEGTWTMEKASRSLLSRMTKLFRKAGNP